MLVEDEKIKNAKKIHKMALDGNFNRKNLPEFMVEHKTLKSGNLAKEEDESLVNTFDNVFHNFTVEIEKIRDLKTFIDGHINTKFKEEPDDMLSIQSFTLEFNYSLVVTTFDEKIAREFYNN